MNAKIYILIMSGCFALGMYAMEAQRDEIADQVRLLLEHSGINLVDRHQDEGMGHTLDDLIRQSAPSSVKDIPQRIQRTVGRVQEVQAIMRNDLEDLRLQLRNLVVEQAQAPADAQHALDQQIAVYRREIEQTEEIIGRFDDISVHLNTALSPSQPSLIWRFVTWLGLLTGNIFHIR